MNNKGFFYFICMVSAMGGLLFGYDWVVIGGAKPFYEPFFGIAADPMIHGVAMSTALVGCLVGAMVAGALADKYGRKPLLIASAVLFTVSAVMTGAVDGFTLFNIARFVGGIGIGVASALSPVYIAEVSPAEIRGRMVSLNQKNQLKSLLTKRNFRLDVLSRLSSRKNVRLQLQRWLPETLHSRGILFHRLLDPLLLTTKSRRN